ncbi:MAG: TraU family protein [Sulfuricaulis sp.]
MYSRAITILLLTMSANLAAANMPATSDDPSCPDGNVISGRLITDLCWSCMFPIRVAGVSLGGDPSNVPSGAASGSMCVCDDALGVPHPGFIVSMWEPAKLIELVRAPGCSATLGGIKLPLTDWRQQGTSGAGDWDAGDTGFYHFHYYTFPLLVMLDLFVEERCNPDAYMDLDLAYMSELDPTWSDEILAFFVNPESAAVANPLAISACAADAASAAVGQPIESLWWCAGAWGTIYPISGIDFAAGSMPENTSLLATRAVAGLHRRGLAWRTLGNDALCRGSIEPTFPKSQYRMSMFYPVPEAGDSYTYTAEVTDAAGNTTTETRTRTTAGSHPIGQTTFVWGEWRVIPGVGEDAIYVLWRWHDCCATF